MATPRKKIVLAYSGGLDTSVAVPWLQENYNADVITCTIDLGMVDLETIRQRAYAVGALDAVTVDGRETLVEEFLWPALRAGAIYEGQYPLATALGRPLIARYLADVARQHGADAVAHGCTGKGNDQVRIEVGVSALAPGVELIAPIREWGMNREDEVLYARERNLPIAPSNNKYSTDENLWGRSAEAGELEDPWVEPPEDAYEWTVSPAVAPDEPAYVEIRFDEGIPTSVDGETMAGVALIGHLNELAGAHGIGRIDHVENRLVGIFTEWDVVNRVAGLVEDMTQETIADYMTADPLTLKEDLPIAQALNLMSIHGFRHLPLVDEDGQPKGIISFRDVVRYLNEALGGQ